MTNVHFAYVVAAVLIMPNQLFGAENKPSSFPQGRSSHLVAKLNHCGKDDDCFATQLYFEAGKLCPAQCGSVGLLINRAEKSAFAKLRKKLDAASNECPSANCPPFPAAAEIPLKCVKSKCEVDKTEAKQGF